MASRMRMAPGGDGTNGMLFEAILLRRFAKLSLKLDLSFAVITAGLEGFAVNTRQMLAELL
jgi:hypothetical protein